MPKFYEVLNRSKVDGKFSGLLVLGDVHGDLASFSKAIEYATQNNLYIVSLGDLVDYGPNSKEIINITKAIKDEDRISIILGNHERKLFKYFIQKKEGTVRIMLKPALLASINSFGDDDASINNFTSLYSEMANILQYNNVYFTHGALHKDMLVKQDYNPIAYQMTLFGEIDNTIPKREDGYPNRVYGWVSQIPADVTVYVGHDIRSRENPVVEGSVVFLDTGCSKEGFLSGAVLNTYGEFIEFVRF